MQPENTQSGRPLFENAPSAPIAPGEVPVLPMPEAAPLKGGERFEQASEARSLVADAASIAQPVPLSQPVVNNATPGSDPAVSTQFPAPLVAADEDLIEKEWVDKAKQIVESTKDNPHARSEQVNRLKLNYREKRFGKVVGASD